MDTDKPKAANKLKAGDAFFMDSEFSLRRMTARPQRGVPYEDLFKPGFWSYHTQNVLNPGTLVDVLPEDGSYYALLTIQSKNSQGIVMAEILKKDLQDSLASPLATEEVFVEWGGAHKWRVVRTDGDVLAKDFTNEQDAHAWVVANRKTIVAKPVKAA